MRRRRGAVRWAAVWIVTPLAVGCASRVESGGEAPGGPGVAPALVVERFLTAVNARDYETMARLFGTREGSILARDPRPEVEKRMFALASVLRHEDYALEGEAVAPGRSGEAIRILVRMHVGDRRVRVPFTVVRTARSGWLVEQIDIEAITAGR